MLEAKLQQYYYRWLLEPVLRLCGRRLSPNVFSISAGILGLLFIPVIASGHAFWALGLLLLSGYCDTFDGALARYQQRTATLGAVLDITIDRLVEFSVLLGLYWVDPINRGLWVVLMLGSILLCVTTFLVVASVSANHSEKSFYYSPGLIERAEAFLFFIAMILWPAAFAWLAGLFSILVLFTAAMHIVQFARISRTD
ncbi:MAG: CDP-alcohol phosphatidyltransferase family protein [Gammaproteobacteria bacterium]|nr:CDP-alcohol phosphatidyltransferase family protein [Gammaproteobacteria bacterium]